MRQRGLVALRSILAWTTITYRQCGRFLICGVFAWLLLGTFAAAAVTVYLSEAELGDGAAPSNLDLKLDAAAIGTTGSFNIWVKTNELVAGVGVSLKAFGDSIRFLDSTVPMYAPRWLSATDGSIPDYDPGRTTLLDLEAYAIPGFGITGPTYGIDPARTMNDTGYDPIAGAFHFATIDYEVRGLGTTTFWLHPTVVGIANESECAHFGVGDVCENPYTGAAVVFPGPSQFWNLTVDGTITVVPEPATISLFVLAFVVVVGLARAEVRANAGLTWRAR